MCKTNGECFVGSEDVLRALETAGLRKSGAVKGQAKNGQDVLVQFYNCNMASCETPTPSPERIKEMVINEFLLCIRENHVTTEILDVLCRFVAFEPLAGQRLIAYYKMFVNV